MTRHVARVKGAAKTHLRNLLGAATCGAARREGLLLTATREQVSCGRCLRLRPAQATNLPSDSALLRTAQRLYGRKATLDGHDEHLELRAAGKLMYAAYSERGGALEMLAVSVDEAWKRERARKKRREPLDPVELARELLSHVLPERSTSRSSQIQRPHQLGSLIILARGCRCLGSLPAVLREEAEPGHADRQRHQEEAAQAQQHRASLDSCRRSCEPFGWQYSDNHCICSSTETSR
jgi:hypothetical protein